MDFFLAEVECGTSTLAAVVVSVALAHGKAAGDKHASSVNRVYLVSRATKNRMETRPSLPFRLELVQCYACAHNRALNLQS